MPTGGVEEEVSPAEAGAALVRRVLLARILKRQIFARPPPQPVLVPVPPGALGAQPSPSST